jgi:hypothetical protein
MKEDEKLKILLPPVIQEPGIPSLYHFKKFEGKIAVLWNWKGDSGTKFQRK